MLAGFIKTTSLIATGEQFFLAANAISEQPGMVAYPDFNGDGRMRAVDVLLGVQMARQCHGPGHEWRRTHRYP